MATAKVTLNWEPRPAEEQVNSYVIYQDGVAAGEVPAPPFEIPDVSAGVHNYEVASKNIWGESAKSASVSTPPAAGVPGGLSINITVTVGATA